MSSQGGLMSIPSKNFVKFCLVLSNTFTWALFQVGRCYVDVQVDGFHMRVLRVYVALMADFYLRKNPKSKWSNCCFLRVRENWKSLENTQNHWLCETLESWKFSELPTIFGAWQWDIFLINLFQKLYPSLSISVSQ